MLTALKRKCFFIEDTGLQLYRIKLVRSMSLVVTILLLLFFFKLDRKKNIRKKNKVQNIIGKKILGKNVSKKAIKYYIGKKSFKKKGKTYKLRKYHREKNILKKK